MRTELHLHTTTESTARLEVRQVEAVEGVEQRQLEEEVSDLAQH